MRVSPQKMEEVGGFRPHQIVEEIGNVVRQECCSVHIAKQTMEQNVEVMRLISKENVEGSASAWANC